MTHSAERIIYLKKNNMEIKTVTITGADDNTHKADMISISKDFPFVEWGILFSRSRQGSERYPSLVWVDELMRMVLSHNCMEPNQPKLSAHLCGDYTVEYLSTGYMTKAFLDLRKVMSGVAFSRYQLNFNSTKNIACKDFYESINRCSTNQILQYNKANYDLCQNVIQLKNTNIHFLHDGSGGRGVLPGEWQEVIPNHFTGYAGGLNPDNLEDSLVNINKAAGDNQIWIDTETGVRTDGVLDLKKVVKFLEISSKYVK